MPRGKRGRKRESVPVEQALIVTRDVLGVLPDSGVNVSIKNVPGKGAAVMLFGIYWCEPHGAFSVGAECAVCRRARDADATAGAVEKESERGA